jgi:hypothetical protein
MTITTIRTKIDDWLTPRWAWLTSKQDDYFTANGHYFQGLWTHTNELEQTDALDGDQIPDNLTSSPADQTHTWQHAVGNALDALPLPARLRLDVYEGPQGHGWVARLQVKYQGNIYERAKQVGPETHHTHTWQKIDP